MKEEQTINYLTYDQAQDLVNRISERTLDFNYKMSFSEKDAMAQLLSDIGVNTSDLIDVSNLADNYAINAEIVEPSETKHYENIEDDSLFSWEEDDGTHYCYSW